MTRSDSDESAFYDDSEEELRQLGDPGSSIEGDDESEPAAPVRTGMRAPQDTIMASI